MLSTARASARSNRHTASREIVSSSKPATIFATRGDNLDIRFKLVHIGGQIIDAHFHRRGKIYLVHDDKIRSKEHMRVFPDHVLAFRDAHHDDASLRPEREFGRADQVPDVLNENQFESLQIDLTQCFAHQVGVEMTAIDQWQSGPRARFVRRSGPRPCWSLRRR